MCLSPYAPPGPTTMPRFVVLHHQTDAGSHYDLMFEAGDILKTWSLTEQPQSNRELRCTSLPDHRLAYLEYEGPISGGQGFVTRWDQGTYQRQEPMGSDWVVELHGERLAGKATLAPPARQSEKALIWTFCYLPRPT